MRLELSGWQLSALSAVPRAAQGTFPATVPGCVHTDLLAAGIIEDPYLAQNEPETAWIGRTDWRYSCTFTATEALLSAEHLTLVCDGLDTVAQLSLNGERFAATESVHVGYRFELKRLVRKGKNRLEVIFRSPYTYAEAKQLELGDLPGPYDEPFNFIRKLACNFGWDWGPTLVTSGIWRDIYLESWSGVRFSAVRPLVTEAAREQGRVNVFAALEGDAAGQTVHAKLKNPAGDVVAEAETEGTGSSVQLTLNVSKPERWWPRGHGERPLYTLELTSGEAVWQGRIGIRKVELNTTPDDIGAAFTLKVNGKPIFCKGANWIPDDCFPARVTKERLRERLTQAVDANMNLLRVWGGGVYESEDFYGLCDELGLMVWQDFLFACAAYPEEAPFPELVEAEARYNVTRLSPHPSLVLWNGNNENLWGYEDWGWQDVLGERTWGRGFYLELLPRIVAELDPSRPYWPGSPYSGEGVHPNADSHGPKHIWDVWNTHDYTHYRDYRPRFAAEFGFQAPPTYRTLARSIPESERFATSAAMLHHQKVENGNDKLKAGLEAHFGSAVTGTPEDFDDWLYLTQLNQARAVQLGVEWFRSLEPRCTGTVYWQLNDCWPATSWAAIDGYGYKKPLWYATKRSFADQLMTFQPAEGGLKLMCCNDSELLWMGEICVQRVSFSGNVLAEELVSFCVQPRTAAVVSELGDAFTAADPEREFLVARTGAQKATWFFLPDKKLSYPRPSLEGSLEGDKFTVTAQTFIRDLTFFVDRLGPDADIDDQLVTLLPGESQTLTVKGLNGINVDDLLKPPVMNCANRFGSRLRDVASAER